MKKYAKEINKPQPLLFNISFSNGIFLESLKLADIIPIHKEKKKAEHFFNNYRPISLISNIDKIMKKLVF